ncbi:MAG: TIGR04076 family protein [Coriobacteriia bacterium]|nr:TIGR04076 family protein [Coriobacteriia bacterium]
MNRFEIEVEKVTGHCDCGYEVGDRFECDGLNTPKHEFCGGAYMAVFPLIVALHSGASFGFEDNPLSKTGLACPDRGNVVFRVTSIPNESTG